MIQCQDVLMESTDPGEYCALTSLTNLFFCTVSSINRTQTCLHQRHHCDFHRETTENRTISRFGQVFNSEPPRRHPQSSNVSAWDCLLQSSTQLSYASTSQIHTSTHRSPRRKRSRPIQMTTTSISRVYGHLGTRQLISCGKTSSARVTT